MEFLEFKELYFDLEKRYLDIYKYLDLDNINKILENLKKQTLKEDFWINKKEASDTLKKISKAEYDLEFYENINSEYENLKLCFELGKMHEKLESESIDIVKNFSNLIEQLEIKKTLNEKDDYRDAIIQIHPGAGGVESQDWAQMLFRMYSKWMHENKFSSRWTS